MTTYKIVTHIPYFYIIKHIPSNKKYAGARWAQGCHPSELLVSYGYKTSSPIVEKLIFSDGLDSFIIESIITEFDSFENAHDYETNFLKVNNCAASDEWLNMHNNDMRIENTEENLLKIKNSHFANFGKWYPQTEESKERFKNIQFKMYDNKYFLQTDEAKQQIQNTNIAKYNVKYFTQSDAYRESVNSKRITYACEHCGYETTIKNDFSKSHGGKCDQNPSNIKVKPIPPNVDKNHCRKTPKCKEYPSLTYIMEAIRYDGDGNVWWNKRPVEHFTDQRICNTINTLYADKQPTNNINGRFNITLQQTTYWIDELVWIIKTGNPPLYNLKHLDGDVGNSKFENLAYSTIHHIKSDKGFKGVHKKPNGTFSAQLFVNGKNQSLGCFKTAEEAALVYVDAKEKLINGKIDEISFVKNIKKNKEINIPNVHKDKLGGYALFYQNEYFPLTYIGRIAEYGKVEDIYNKLQECKSEQQILDIIQDIKNRKNENLKNKGLTGTRFENGKYLTVITVNGRTNHLGTYNTPEEAHEKYLEADAYRKIHKNLDGFMEAYYESLKVVK